MMNQGIFTVIENSRIGADIYSLRLSGDCSAIAAPGQFAGIKIEGKFLRRPFSVCDWDTDSLRIVYRVVGDGTQLLSQATVGETIDVMTGLGNGFDVAKCGVRTLVVGGGVGIPPMYGLAKRLLEAGKSVTAVLGYNTARDAFWAKEFEMLGIPVVITTADGSLGKKGFVTDGMAGLDYDSLCTCGPEAMLKAVYNACPTSGQFSFEERMGCGFGACMGCTCKTKYGNKRICKDGPVLEKEEIIW